MAFNFKLRLFSTCVFYLVCSYSTVKGNEITDSLLLSNQLDSIAEYNFEQGNDSLAIQIGFQGLRIREKILGKKHPDYAISLQHLATYFFEIGDYTEAHNYISEAIEIQKDVLGTNHSDYAESLMTLADIYSMNGQYEDALSLGKEAVEIVKKNYGEESLEYANYLGGLASYYFDYDNVTESTKLCEEGLRIYTKNEQKFDPEYATLLIHLAKCKTIFGDYLNAIHLEKEAEEIYRNSFGINHPFYATLLSCMAYAYSEIGDDDEAISLETEALKIYQKAYGIEHNNCAVSLQNIGEYYFEKGEEYDSCLIYSSKAKQIYETIFGKQHPSYFKILDVQAKYYYSMGNYIEALRMGNEALQLKKDYFGDKHPSCGISLLNIAEYQFHNGNFEESLPLAIQALETFKQAYGVGHPMIPYALDLISYIYSEIHNYENAFIYEKESMELLSNYVSMSFSNATYRQRYFIWKRLEERFLAYSSLAYRYPISELISDVYNKSALLARGLLLDTDKQFKHIIMESKDSFLIDKSMELSSTILLYNDLIDLPIEERAVNIDSLKNVIQELEFELIKKSQSFGNFIHNMNLTWKDVQKHLRKNDVAIEFLRFQIKNDSIMYVALTLRKDFEAPKMIKLFEEKQLRHVSDTSYYQCRDMADLIWKPLRQELKGIKNIFFSPAGALYNMGIEYLPGMEEYNIYRLSSTRELVNKNDSRVENKAVLYGNLDYNAQLDTLNVIKSVSGLNELFKERADVRGLKLRGGQGALEYTKEEVEQISSELEHANWNYVLDTLSMGTEESFKALSGRKVGYLHIATHGFYYSQEEADDTGYKFFRVDNQYATEEDKSLTRSGLIMSGANHILEGKSIPDNVEDGILTAKEIADLDLRGLDLVVLSACQTGLGDIFQCEGVFGLQRGFKKAGANTILMSLWEVDDKATQILMTQFYKNLVSGQTKCQALKSAQKYLREVECGKYDEPRYWAAFILLDGIEK